jgi:Ca2+-binding RTX toxin-like protein
MTNEELRMYLTSTGRSLSLTSGTNNWTMTGTLGVSRTGTVKNDVFDVSTTEKVAGLGGDDVYKLWSAGATIIEQANGGNDTVYVGYWGGINLADNIENVVLSSAGATWANGNALDNLMIAGTAGAKLNGGKGNDVLVGGVGADIFTIEKGNGSDAIMNFKPGWDIVNMATYGFTSFSQLKAAGTQSGADTVFKLGNGETLTLRDVKLNTLSASDFNLPSTGLSVGVDQMALQAYQGRNYNGWVVLTNAWGSSNLKEGVDFTLKSVFNPKDATAGTTFEWSYPISNAANAKILAYPEVIFGHSPLDIATSNPNDKAAVFPVKVSNMVGLKADYDVTFSGNLAEFNVSYDIWLSKDPKAIGKQYVSNEIMVWVHKGGFEAFGKVVGTYQWGDAKATIYHEGTYTAVVFDRDIPKGNLDVGAIMQKLVELNIVSKDEYIRSLEFGSEVNGGQGKLVINNLDLSVQTSNADGSITTKTVTGSGTTVDTVQPVSSKPVPTKASLLAQDNFKAAVTDATKAAVDDNGHKIGTQTSTTNADGSVLIKEFTLLGALSGSQLIVNLGTSIQIQHFDAAGKFTGAEQRDFAKDGMPSVSQFDASWKVTGSSLTVDIGNGRTEVQHFDANYKLIGADQMYTETNGAHTTLHYGSNWAFTGATTVYSSATSTSTYMYDANWVLQARDKVVFSAATDSDIVMTSHYDGASKLLGADQVRYYADHTTYTHYDAKNVLTGGKDVYLQKDGSLTSITFDANQKAISQSLDGTALANTMQGSALATDFHSGAGSDVLKGGAGVDRFFFDTDIRKGEFDTITGFTLKQDKIALDHDIFSALNAGTTLDAKMFAAGKVAQDANTHVLYDAASQNLYYDADGKGGADAILIANIKASGMLSATDFILV